MVLSSYLWPIVLQQPQNEQLPTILLEDTSTTSKVLVERTHTATLLPHFTSDWVIFLYNSCQTGQMDDHAKHSH